MQDDVRDIEETQEVSKPTVTEPTTETADAVDTVDAPEWGNAKFEGHDTKATIPEETTEETITDIPEDGVQPEIALDKVEDEPEATTAPEATPPELPTEPVKADIPEQVQKILDFMADTGGTLDDFNLINKDYSQLDENTLIKNFIKAENPDFTPEEVNWEFEDKFETDEFEDEDSREFKKASLEKKRTLTKAGKYFDGLKEKYLTDLKASPKGIPKDYQDAYAQVAAQNEQVVQSEKWDSSFKEGTAEVFSDDFKGFVFDTGEGKFRMRESDFASTKETQSDFNALSKEHLDAEGTVKNMGEYQKAVYAARNADKLAKHFYQQGKADALTERAKTTKNIDMQPKVSDPSANPSGYKVKFLDLKGQH